MRDGKLVLGQIGCGAFAAGQDMPNYAASERVVCKWCCDVSEASARQLADEYGVPRVTTDFMDIIADPEVDLVKISTSHEVHLPIIEAAAAAGKHVFCEKPMAMEDVEALKIIRAVRRSGIKLCVDLNRRMAPALHALRRRWQGHRADPQHNPWRYVECPREPWPDELHSHFLVRVQDDTMTYRPIHLDPLRGGGEIIAETVHWLDLSCWMFEPQIPVEVQAWGSARFSHGIHVTFSGGDTATILFHCGGTFDYPKELFEMTCRGALLRSEFFVENRYYGMPGVARETFPLLRDCMPDVGTEGGFSGYTAKYDARVRGLANSKAGHNTLSVNKGWSAMLDGFLDAILADTPSPCDEMAGYLSTYLAKLAIQSIQLRQALPAPLDKVKFTVV